MQLINKAVTPFNDADEEMLGTFLSIAATHVKASSVRPLAIGLSIDWSSVQSPLVITVVVCVLAFLLSLISVRCCC